MKYRFDYPAGFISLPAYSAHRGQLVRVIRKLRRDEYDFEGEAMFEIQAEDGWTGHAWRSELERQGATIDA